MGPAAEVAGLVGSLIGGGGSLIDGSEHHTNVEIDPNIDVSTHNTSIDSHNTTVVNQTTVVQSVEEHHSSGGASHHKPACDPHMAAMQQRLQDEGYYDPGPIDGIMGPRTMAALDAEQRGHLKHHDDPNGVADEDTYGSHHLAHQREEQHHAHHGYQQHEEESYS